MSDKFSAQRWIPAQRNPFGRVRLAAAVVAPLLLSTGAGAEMVLGTPFGDHMVLQRDVELPVWGWADAGARIVVSLGNASRTATADEQGEWRVALPPMPVGGPHELIIAGPEEVRVRDVLVGEVWFCSGQSNMVMALRDCENAEAEVRAADYPQIRMLTVPPRRAGMPERQPTDRRPAWQVCSPGTAGAFSGVAYFFGRELHRELNVPVGLIVGGASATAIQPWVPREGLAAVPELREWYNAALAHDRAYREALAAGLAAANPPAHNYMRQAGEGNLTTLYNATVAPCVPYAIRGVIWYQGESNRGDSSQAYYHFMAGLVRGWRAAWGQGDFPFYYVQIGALDSWRLNWQIPEIWEGQTRALSLPNTGMAVIHDLCGDLSDIHPKAKQEVGRRLALWALAKDYGRKNLPFSGPIYRSSRIENARVRIEFDYAFGGLRSRDGTPLTWFTIAGPDRRFVPARAEIEGETVVVWSDDVPDPQAVRFAWDETAQPNLVNGAGLPAGAFRTRDPW